MMRLMAMCVMAVLLCSCGSKPAGPKKAVSAWRVKLVEVAVGTTAENFARYEKLSAKNDQVQMQQMLLRGELFLITRGVEVEMLDRDTLRSKIRVKDGPQEGKEGYLPSDAVEQVILKE